MTIKKIIIKGGWGIQSTDYDVVLSGNNRHFLRVYNGTNGSKTHLSLSDEDLAFAQEIAENFDSHDVRRALALSRLADRLMRDRYGL